MSSCQELIIIFDRIQSRVDKGANNYTEITKYVMNRIKIEEEAAINLKKIIPPDYDSKDPILKVFFEELKSEAEQHSTFAAELRKKVVTPANSYTQTMREKQKKLTSSLRTQKSAVNKAINDTEKAQRDVEYNKARCNGLQGSALTKQQQKVFKATQDYNNKSKIENQTAQTISSSQMPNIHREFSEFDTRRLNNLQKATVQFGQLKKALCESIMNGTNSCTSKMEGMDCNDRSNRYVARVFDASNEQVADDENIETFATAISDYTSEDPRDLKFERGDKIRVLGQHHSGWWEGELDGKRGFFPKTFVVMPGEVDLRKDPIGAVFLVIKDYDKARGGDISLLTGDLVYVDYLSKDRCSGTNLRDHKRGYFPLNCLECRISSNDSHVNTERSRNKK